MRRRLRFVGLALHGAYVVALLGAAVAAYVWGHREPSGPLAVIVWVAYERTDLVGWQVAVTGALAASSSLLFNSKQPSATL